MTYTTRYEIAAYDGSGEQLSLNENRSDSDEIHVITVWDAIAALSAVPARAWKHWDDGDSEQVTVARVVLRHLEVRHNTRGVASYFVNTLETVYR